MQPTQQKPLPQVPTLRPWEVSGMGLPRMFVKAYSREQAKNEYRIAYQLHESRPVTATEVKDGS